MKSLQFLPTTLIGNLHAKRAESFGVWSIGLRNFVSFLFLWDYYHVKDFYFYLLCSTTREEKNSLLVHEVLYLAASLFIARQSDDGIAFHAFFVSRYDSKMFMYSDATNDASSTQTIWCTSLGAYMLHVVVSFSGTVGQSLWPSIETFEPPLEREIFLPIPTFLCEK